MGIASAGEAMSQQGLVDIEELAQRVRSAPARSVLNEAINCYKVGAYRSCVVTTWIALVYDFIDKFRELALSNDASAKELIQKFDDIQKHRKVDEALKFERDVLSVAAGQFELISSQELADLQRLFDDRNRFGHPNLNQELDSISCTPELARTHMRTAVELVMQRPPVQGKAALSAIRDVVDSKYFPTEAENALIALRGTPLARAKKIVVREFFLGCVSSLIIENPTSETFYRRLAAAQACRRMHPETVDELIASRLPPILEKVSDSGFPYLVTLVAQADEYLVSISEPLKVRIRSFIEGLPSDLIQIINFAAQLDFCSDAVRKRLSKISDAELSAATQKSRQAPAPLVIERAIDLFCSAKSWNAANSYSSVIAETMVENMTTKQAKTILDAGQNKEVAGAFGYPNLLGELVKANLLSLTEVKVRLQSFDIGFVVDRLPADVVEEIPF